MNGLIRAGKVRHFGLSNVPAWWVARMATLAQAHGLQGPVMLRLFYFLVERTVEHEHVPPGAEFGIALQPWAPLATGLLTGKYAREDVSTAGGRLSGENLFGDSLFTDRNRSIVDALRAVAAGAGLPPLPSCSRIVTCWSTSADAATGLAPWEVGPACRSSSGRAFRALSGVPPSWASSRASPAPRRGRRAC